MSGKSMFSLNSKIYVEYVFLDSNAITSQLSCKKDE